MNRIKAVFRKFAPLLFFIVFCIPNLSPQTSFSQGEELFLQNKPQEALPYLEETVARDPAHMQAFLYLGIVYQQLDRLDDAITVYLRILPRAGAETARVSFNLGNVYFAKGDFEQARQYYTRTITADPSFASAYLNRANALVQSGQFEDALADYAAYLSMESDSSQLEEVTKIMTLIREELVFLEQQFEQQFVIVEDTIRNETDRRRRFILDVTESLRTVVEDIIRLSSINNDQSTTTFSDFNNDQ